VDSFINTGKKQKREKKILDCFLIQRGINNVRKIRISGVKFISRAF
jgi:hypothetical protein